MRPPQNESSEPDTIEFGIAALNARIDDSGVSFPATAGEVVESVQTADIPYDGSGNTIHLGEVLSQAGQQEFDNQTELLNTVHPIFEEKRANSAPGFIERIKNAFGL
jgi:hypothetical protein